MTDGKLIVYLEIVNWIQKTYGYRKIGPFTGLKDQWVVTSYVEDSVLVLLTCRGRKEGRLIPYKKQRTLIALKNIGSLQDFKQQFNDLINEEYRRD